MRIKKKLKISKQNEEYLRILNEAAKQDNNNFGRNFIDWCISIQREFSLAPDSVLELSYFRFRKMQDFLIREQKEAERSMKRK